MTMNRNAAARGLPTEPAPSSLGSGDALVLIDFQTDFMPGGALPVPLADLLLPRLNRCIQRFEERHLLIVFTRDWHPAAHRSFRTQGGPWPSHCVADSPGARFANGLRMPSAGVVFSKAVTPDSDSYSDFDEEGFETLLCRADVGRLFIAGVATEYCVKATVLDALACGFEVFVLGDLVGAIDLTPGDGARALGQMIEAGARITTSDALS